MKWQMLCFPWLYAQFNYQEKHCNLRVAVSGKMKEGVSKLTYPTLQHCLRMLYTMNGNSKHKWRAIGQKRGYNGSNQHFMWKCISTHYVFQSTKFHAILLSGFNGVVLTNCFSSIFHFRQISKFKKGQCSQKTKLNQNFLWICTSTHYVLHY